ncbi:hypothetical protein V6N13_105637 [Hibiscus sabdariffa]|uniref:non-specific serine/threonine protein kinase n=1 Tax=Hibiscus sabdariffa TaxID=183260 RepID=A0ABR2EYB8_9ROSI
MSHDSSNTGPSPPAPPGSSLPGNGAGKNVGKDSPVAPSPDSTSPSLPPPNDSSNKQPSSPSSDKKSPEAPPPPATEKKKSPPLPPPSTSESPPVPQTPRQQTPAPPQTQSSQQRSQPAPNSHSNKSPSSTSTSISSSSSSSSSSESSSSSSSSFPSFLSSSSSTSSTAAATTASSSSSSSTSSPSDSDSSDNSNETILSPPSPSPSPTPSPSSFKLTSSSSTAPANGHSTPSSSSGSDSSNNNTQNSVSSSSHDKTPSYQSLIATVVGVLVVVFIVLFFYSRARKKKQQRSTPGSNMPPPANLTMTPVTYEDGQTGQSSGLDAVHGQPCTTANTPQRGPDSGIMAGPKTYFTYEELMEMTDGFSSQNLIGKGGFGCVYKGRMPDGRVVAVKQLKADSGQGEREFRAEVEIINRVHHKHLVSLVGYSTAENQRLLIYEFVPNRTLEHHLHGKDLPVLEWAKRVKIALGAAKGLAYLHEDFQHHQNAKNSSNLLKKQVADFGLARLNDATQSQTHVSTRVMGTFGYLAPEYASSGKLTDRSDVYSFGVVLLELITGRKPIDSARPLGDESLVEWARPLLIQALETGDHGELIDPRLENRYEEREIVRMIEAAAACVRHSFSNRPHMALVVRALDFEGDPDLSNGVKYGDSTAYDSAKYSEEIVQFRQTAAGSGENSSEMDMHSRGYNSGEVSGGRQSPWNSQYSSGDYTSGELETRALEPDSGEYRGDSRR